MRPRHLGGIALVVCSLLAVLSVSSASALQQPYVQVVGCSNSERVELAYKNVSARDVTVNSAAGNAALLEWSTPSAWATFDSNYATYGATSVWFPMCIRSTDFGSDEEAWTAFLSFLDLLRARTQAPLYLSPTNGSPADCPTDDKPEQQYVTDRAVAEGLALRGPDIPTGSVLTGECHFDPVLSTNVGSAGAAFLDDPSISSFTPVSGLVGTLVTISGGGLTGATAVTFNGTAATYSVVSDAQITATVPSGATTGPIAVTTPGGTATSASSFTVWYAPSISSFTPTKGPVGTLVTINGSGFTSATAVKFNGTVASYTVLSDAQITATVPSAAKTGKISVTTPGGTATSATSFLVTKK